MLRVLHITARADHSGGPRHVYDLVSGLRHAVDVYVACPLERPFRDRFADLVGSGKITTIPHRRLTLPALLELRALIRRERIDLVHSHGRGAGFYSRPLALLTGVKCVHTFHYLNPSSRLRVLEEKVMGWWATALVAVSPSEAECVRRLGVAPVEKLHLIPNGVAVVESPPPMLPIRQVIGIMRLEPDKSPNTFVDVCGLLSGHGLQFRVLGSGTMLSQLRASGPVTFEGAVDEPRDYLAPDSVYLATSRGEGSSLAMLDAMARGIPVVASDVAGNCDLIRDGENGLLYPWGDARRAAELMLRLIGDDGLRQRLGLAAWRTVSDSFRAEKMVDRVLALYGRL